MRASPKPGQVRPTLCASQEHTHFFPMSDLVCKKKLLGGVIRLPGSQVEPEAESRGQSCISTHASPRMKPEQVLQISVKWPGEGVPCLGNRHMAYPHSSTELLAGVRLWQRSRSTTKVMIATHNVS